MPKKNYAICENNLTENQKVAISELSELLGVELSSGGEKLKITRIDRGIYVDVQNREIRYGKDNEFFRALYLFLANYENNSYIVDEKCVFERLTLMCDSSRNGVMKIQTLKDLIKRIATYGYSELMLYTEDTFEIEGEPYFGYMRGRFSKNEIKEVESYCAIFGIELVPCIQTLAHLNQIVRYDHYQNFIDCDDILLCDDDRTYELIDKMFKTLSENFACRKVNIGMDETHNLGLGKYLEKFGYQTRYEIMSKHLKKVKEIADKYGFKASMWSDMFFRLIFGGSYEGDADKIPQDFLDSIPKDIDLIYWDYYSVKIEKYQNCLKNHFKLSQNISFAGGAWRWNGFAPDNDYSIKTVSQSLKACKQFNVKNYTLTAWGDNGAESSIFEVLPSIYYTAFNAYAKTDSNLDVTIDEKPFYYSEKVKFCDYMLLDLPNKVVANAEYERNNANKFFLYNDLLLGTFDSLAFDGIENVYKNNKERLQKVDFSNSHFKYHFENIIKLLEILEIKVELGKKIRIAYQARDVKKLSNCCDDLSKTIKLVNEFYLQFVSFWERENKSFGLEVQNIRLGGLIFRLNYVLNVLQKYINGEVEIIGELEEKLLPFAYFENAKLETLIYNDWKVTVSPSIV